MGRNFFSYIRLSINSFFLPIGIHLCRGLRRVTNWGLAIMSKNTLRGVAVALSVLACVYFILLDRSGKQQQRLPLSNPLVTTTTDSVAGSTNGDNTNLGSTPATDVPTATALATDDVPIMQKLYRADLLYEAGAGEKVVIYNSYEEAVQAKGLATAVKRIAKLFGTSQPDAVRRHPLIKQFVAAPIESLDSVDPALVESLRRMYTTEGQRAAAKERTPLQFQRKEV